MANLILAEVIDIAAARAARTGGPRIPYARRLCTCPACAWDRDVLAMLDETRVLGETAKP